MGKILITGATGGLGSTVANFLKEKQGTDNIAVMVRNPEADKAKALAADGFEIRVADYADKESLLKAFAGIDTLYFVSGSDMEHRIPQHRNVVDAAVEVQVKHVFYTSAGLNNLSEDAPLFPAMSAHIETEKWLKESGLAYTILQHNLYSEVVPMFLGDKGQLLATKTVFLPTGEGKTAFVSRDELAEAAANLLGNPSAHANKVYALNGSENVSFSTIAKELTEITGEEISYVSPDAETFEKTMGENGVPPAIIGMMLGFGLAIADGVFEFNNTDMEAILERKTQPLADFLKPVYG